MPIRPMKQWHIAQEISDDIYSELAEENRIIAQVIANRGVTALEAKQLFFNPRYENIADPFLMSGMESAVDRLDLAYQNKEKIFIFGDYDVDGCSATAIMLRVLRAYGMDVDYYIPHRIAEGYGMSNGAIDDIAARGGKLLITVDNGSGSYDEVEHAKSLGISVIVTDHHEVTRELPNCVAVINPRQKGDLYPCKDLCGAAVSFQFMRAFVSRMVEQGNVFISDDQLKWQLDLVALATVADVMDISGENRIFVHFGLQVMRKTKNVGLMAMAKMSGFALSEADTQMLGFKIAPRINAAGRMAHASYALNLLTTTNPAEADMLALQLERLNRDRQAFVADSLERLLDKIDHDCSIIVLRDDEWTSGILGLIAGRLSERYGRPVYCSALEGEYIKGSARSSIDFHVVEALKQVGSLLMRYGGHTKAAGYSVLPENYEQFAQSLKAYGDSIKGLAQKKPILSIDAEILFSDITSELYLAMQRLQPFGNMNTEPVFVTTECIISDRKAVGSDKKHLKLSLEKEGKRINGIAFGFGEYEKEFEIGAQIDCVFSIQNNVWNGRANLELMFKDFSSNEL